MYQTGWTPRHKSYLLFSVIQPLCKQGSIGAQSLFVFSEWDEVLTKRTSGFRLRNQVWVRRCWGRVAECHCHLVGSKIEKLSQFNGEEWSWNPACASRWLQLWGRGAPLCFPLQLSSYYSVKVSVGWLFYFCPQIKCVYDPFALSMGPIELCMAATEREQSVSHMAESHISTNIFGPLGYEGTQSRCWKVQGIWHIDRWRRGLASSFFFMSIAPMIVSWSRAGPQYKEKRSKL